MTAVSDTGTMDGTLNFVAYSSRVCDPKTGFPFAFLLPAGHMESCKVVVTAVLDTEIVVGTVD